MNATRYTFSLLALCCFTTFQTAQAQCDIQLDALPTHVLCFGQNNGSINLTASNGAAPYTYLWSNGATTEDLIDLAAGTYTCTVTDALDCTATTSSLVSQPSQIVIDLPGSNILNCNTASIVIDASVSGGTAPYNYLWNNGFTTSTLQANQPGNYSLTVTDQNGCIAISSTIVLLDVALPLSCITAPQVLTCVVNSVQLDGSCSSTGPLFTYQWITANGNFIGGTNTLNPSVDAPGTYNLIVMDVTNGCTATAIIDVVQDINAPFADAGPDLILPCDGGTLTLQGFSSIGNNFTYIWVGPSIVSGSNTPNPDVNQPGVYTLLVTNTINGCTASDVVVVTSGASGLCSELVGKVILDESKDCVHDAPEPSLAHWIVQATGAQGTYYGLTDTAGIYHIFVQPGDTYTVSAVTPSPLWVPCLPLPIEAVPLPNTTQNVADLLIQKLVGCGLLSVDITSGNLRRCFSNNQFSVQYCNYGTEPATDAYIIVTLDNWLTPLGSNLPYTDLGNDQIRFDLGDVAVGECGSFYFLAELSCGAVLGQTHCTEAHIYPDTNCIPVNPQWSGASLRISSECDADSVRFRIENIGFGDMIEAQDYIVVEDQVMIMDATVQLDAGQFVTVSVPANGSTWRLEVPQEPYHPGFSQPALSVEGCTTAPAFSTGFVAMFPPDDADVFVDIDCKANVASSDPNDKQGYPLGYGPQHYVRPGTPLEYQIQFQNTGNDTAFTVRIVDQLAPWLDPATLRPGASSHPYTWDLTGAGTLTFLYENILLADSNVNEPASHGFVKFTIQPRADAPLETLIENTADIYFDFNAAVVTNTTAHRLGVNFVTLGLWQPQRTAYGIQAAPNPFSDETFLRVKGLETPGDLRLQVFDLQGKMLREMRTQTDFFRLQKGDLPAGAYLFRIEQGGRLVGNGKLVAE